MTFIISLQVYGFLCVLSYYQEIILIKSQIKYRNDKQVFIRRIFSKWESIFVKPVSISDSAITAHTNRFLFQCLSHCLYAFLRRRPIESQMIYTMEREMDFAIKITNAKIMDSQWRWRTFTRVRRIWNTICPLSKSAIQTSITIILMFIDSTDPSFPAQKWPLNQFRNNRESNQSTETTITDIIVKNLRVE